MFFYYVTKIKILYMYNNVFSNIWMILLVKYINGRSCFLCSLHFNFSATDFQLSIVSSDTNVQKLYYETCFMTITEEIFSRKKKIFKRILWITRRVCTFHYDIEELTTLIVSQKIYYIIRIVIWIHMNRYVRNEQWQ